MAKMDKSRILSGIDNDIDELNKLKRNLQFKIVNIKKKINLMKCIKNKLKFASSEQGDGGSK